MKFNFVFCLMNVKIRRFFNAKYFSQCCISLKEVDKRHDCYNRRVTAIVQWCLLIAFNIRMS